MCVNLTIRLDIHVAFSLRSPSTIWRYIFWLLFVLRFLKSVLSLIDIENIRNLETKMSGYCQECTAFLTLD